MTEFIDLDSSKFKRILDVLSTREHAGTDRLLLFAIAQRWEQKHGAEMTNKIRSRLLRYISSPVASAPNPWALFYQLEPSETVQDQLLLAWILRELADASE